MNPLRWLGLAAFEKEMEAAHEKIPSGRQEPPIEFRKPSEIVAYEPPPGACLVGDCHIVKGATAVIAGAPGIGKSRAAVALAIAGARGVDWMGLKTHRRFRSLIIQCENGSMRLKQEFAAIGGENLDEFIRISPPPEFGFEFGSVEFAAAVKAAIAEFIPDLVILDPWTATVTDDKGKDYRETLQQLRRVVGSGDTSPALFIVAHTRKPAIGDRAPRGRSLLHEVAGSYVLGAHARCVFSLLAASDDPADDRVVLENPKNNDGKQVPRMAWYRRNGLFAPCLDFDWKEFDRQGGAKSRAAIGIGEMREVFELAGGVLSRQEAADALRELLECSRSVAYEALSLKGRFAEHLRLEGKNLRWIEPDGDSESENA